VSRRAKCVVAPNARQSAPNFLLLQRREQLQILARHVAEIQLAAERLGWRVRSRGRRIVLKDSLTILFESQRKPLLEVWAKEALAFLIRIRLTGGK